MDIEQKPGATPPPVTLPRPLLPERAKVWSPARTVPPKSAYQAERVLLQDWPHHAFHDDRPAYPEDFVGFHIYGECPSCGHQSSALCSAKYLAQEQIAYQDERRVDAYDRLWRHPQDGRVTNVTLLRCACLQPHAGAPDGTFGCGTEWLLRVTYSVTDPRAGVDFYPVRDDEACRYWHPAEDVTDSVPKALAVAQAGAGKWQASLSALVAVLGLAAVLAGRTTIQALDTRWQWVLGVAALVAILGNLGMLYFSDLASFGFPEVKRATAGRTLLDSDLAPLTGAQKSASRLRVAQLCTAAALAGAVVATGVFLFAPQRAAAAGAKLTVTVAGAGDTRTTLTTPCGAVRLDSDTRPTTVTFMPRGSGAAAVVYPIGQVRTIEPC